MNIAIRVDASQQIGTGHFMRCLTLADALSQRGAQIRFISRHLPEYLQDMLRDKGYEFLMLESPANEKIDDLAHSHWLGTTQRIDAAEAFQHLSDRTWEWLVVDHYALDARWESTLRQTAQRILVIDDIADRQHDCDILLDQNFYTDMGGRYSDKVPAYCRLLLGPRYAMLRDEFRLLREQIKPCKGTVSRILVFFGGVDAGNYSGRAIDVLADTKRDGLFVDVVIGMQHPFREQIVASCREYGFTCYVQTSRIAELMATADLAIGAGGSATWERCCLGLPTLAFSTADNQFRQINDAAVEGLLYVPETGEDFNGRLRHHLCSLLENKNLRKLISNRALSAVDGRGVLRVISKMGCTGIRMRPATLDDSEKLFNWRNHPSIRAVSRNSEEIRFPDHQKWYSAVLLSSDRVLLIGEFHDKPVGVVRFDINGNEAEISIYVVPVISMPGIGQELLQSAEDWIVEFRPEIRKINADALGDNARSHHLFSGADYHVEQIAYSKIVYEQV
ncbi:MAG: UDP-2,4-diacetamido-2,4,6-trideoxy-beta-L-altropyranose hydrolase [Chlorobium sp.]